MGIIDLFSKRNAAPADVYSYDDISNKLRAQIVHILEDGLGRELRLGGSEGGWSRIAKALAKEHGLLALPTTRNRYGPDHFSDCLNYVLQAGTLEVLDLVELCMRVLDEKLRSDPYHTNFHPPADDVINELNQRFRENACGYQYESGQIVRVDSQLLHAETVRPTLSLLKANGFEGANDEFLSAHEHLRHRRTEEAIVDACKAFESTMKAICELRKWRYDPKATAAVLIKALIDNGLLPTYSEEHLSSVSKTLLGVATVRNKNAGHGAGSKVRNVPEHLASYSLHLAATNIVFLVKCHQSTK